MKKVWFFSAVFALAITASGCSAKGSKALTAPQSSTGVVADQKQQTFPVWKAVTVNHRRYRLVKLDLYGLKFEVKNPTYGEIKARAESFGLSLCSEELVMALHEQYRNQPQGEFLIVMTKGVSSGIMEVFHLLRYWATRNDLDPRPTISHGPTRLTEEYTGEEVMGYKHYLIFVAR